MALVLWVGNDMVLELDNLQNANTSTYDNAATVTVTLVDEDGTGVSGQSWPAALSHVSESPDQGKYRVTLENDIAIVMGQKYTAQITATGSGSEVGYWEVPVRPQARTA